jgi:hypothetical protein
MSDPFADPFGLEGPWRTAADRIIRMMSTGMAGDNLPMGPGSHIGIERYAREVVAANPQSDLGIMYGLCSVAVCVASQGGYVMMVPVAGGGFLDVPAIQHFIGIAPSGWRKSTALNVAKEPLKKALARGEKLRRTALPKLRDDAEKDAAAIMNYNNIPGDIQKAQFLDVYNGGYCAATLVKDPTVEALRNMLVQNGGVAAVMAGEADVFRNVTAYSTDSGSLTFFLDGWSQDDVLTSRAGQGMMAMDEAALILGVLFQTDVFAEVTSGSGRGGSSGGADSFQQRGVFGRILIREAVDTGGWETVAADYSDDASWEGHEGKDGMSDQNGRMSTLGLALADYTKALEDLVADTNNYRMMKALRHSWLLASTKYGAAMQVPEIDQVPRHPIKLDRAALVAYSRIQRMHSALMDALGDMDPDTQALWEPMASRFTQHVLREALVVSLGAGRREVTAEILEDCALRVMPWRWGLSTRALVKRQFERAENIIAASFSDNAAHEDLSPEAKILKALSSMYTREPRLRQIGWTHAEVVRRATSTISPKSARLGVGPRLQRALEGLSVDPTSGISRIEDGKTPDGTMRYRYLIDPSFVDSRSR